MIATRQTEKARYRHFYIVPRSFSQKWEIGKLSSSKDNNCKPILLFKTQKLYHLLFYPHRFQSGKIKIASTFPITGVEFSLMMYPFVFSISNVSFENEFGSYF